VVAGDRIYALDDTTRKLFAVDVRDADRPRSTGFVDVEPVAYLVAAAGDTVAVLSVDPADQTVGPSRLRLVDVSGDSPRLEGRLPLERHVVALTIRAGYVFLADIGGVLQVVDIADPAVPRVVSEVRIGDYLGRLGLDGDYLYVVDQRGTDPPAGAPWGTVRVVDVSAPAQPRLVAAWPSEHRINGFAVAPDRLYIGRDDGPRSRLATLDVSDPLRPRLMAELPLGYGDVSPVTHLGGTVVSVLQRTLLETYDLAVPGWPQQLSRTGGIDLYRPSDLAGRGLIALHTYRDIQLMVWDR
jgi:hypothetical protein